MSNPPETPEPFAVSGETKKLSLATEMIEEARRSQALPFRKSPLRKDIKKSPINWSRRNQISSVPHGFGTDRKSNNNYAPAKSPRATRDMWRIPDELEDEAETEVKEHKVKVIKTEDMEIFETDLSDGET